MRNFSELDIEKFIKFQDENVLPKEEFLGRCYMCGEFLDKLELPEGPEKKIVCLKNRDDFALDFEDLEAEGAL